MPTITSENQVDFVMGFIDAAIFFGNDDRIDPEGQGVPLSNNYGRDDINSESAAEVRKDCVDFILANFQDLSDAVRLVYNGVWDCAGHDYFLTRNRHGAGFWDRTSEKHLTPMMDRLTEASHAAGAGGFVSNEDGELYWQNG